MTASAIQQGNFLDEVASQYRKEGFQTRVPNGGDAFDTLLYRLGVRLIAYNDREQIAVLFGRPVSISTARNNLNQLHRLLDGRPGWRLDLKLESGAEDTSPSGQPWSLETIRTKAGFADLLSSRGRWDEASILVWAIFEAVVRIAARKLQVHFPAHVGGDALLKQAAYLGLIDEGELAQGRELLIFRNRATHGLVAKASARRAREREAAAIRTVRSIVDRLSLEFLGSGINGSRRRRLVS
ncbi:MAG: hypothetical protein IT562_16750 [Alphaproteobacteria bacterium]|nr:hypothetical protein [Alphaproteobacteria bacterium]